MARLLLGDSLRKTADRWPIVQQATWAVEAFLFGTFLRIAQVLPADSVAALSRRTLKWLGPKQPKNRIVRRNLQLAFPDKTDEEISILASEIWGNMGAILAEYAHLDDICVHAADERLQIVTQGRIEAFDRPGQPSIIISAHLGNWEVIAAAVTRQGVPLTSVYTPLQNPRLDRILMRRRQALGCRLIPRDESMRSLIRELSAGRSIGMVMDQRVDSGKPIPLFGIDKLTTLIPARLALRHGGELIPARTERLSDARFRVTFYPPVQPDDATGTEIDKAIQMTRKVNQLFEDWIRERPQDWFCTKRRWPKDAKPPETDSHVAGASTVQA